MGKEALSAMTIIAVIIAIGLFLRYGLSTQGIEQVAVAGTENIIGDLTLKGNSSVYPYYGPTKA